MSATSLDSRFTSLSLLRSAHRSLQKEYREKGQTAGTIEAIKDFIDQAKAAGAFLDDERDQSAAQSLLDYWANVLYRADVEVPDTTLAPFDNDRAPKLPDDDVPYVGMDPFFEDRKDDFYGRRRSVEELVKRLRTEDFLAVTGPSGSGKSSLVLAGLIPALKAGAIPGSESWRYLGRMVPGSEPLHNLARLICGSKETPARITAEAERLRGNPRYILDLIGQRDGEPALIVIDQFEELSTLCDDIPARAAFEAILVHLVKEQGRARRMVVLTMRSDFINAIARQPELQHLLETALQPMTPLTAAELREAIEKPASRVGLKFEAGVVEALMHDILGEPAALPLLQFTLLKLWEGREHNLVTLDAYQKLGGGRLALAHTADQFMERLPQDRIMAERILVRLGRSGTGMDNVAQRIRRNSLYSIGPKENVDWILASLRKSGLIRITASEVDQDADVEIAHEALLRNWPYLDNLLQNERSRKVTLLRLEAKAAEWLRLGRGASGLLSGAALIEAESWLSGDQAGSADASDDLRGLIAKSRRAADRARQRERLAKSALAALALASLVFAAGALVQRSAARTQEALAIKSESEARLNEYLANTNWNKALKALGESTSRETDLDQAKGNLTKALAAAKKAEATANLGARLYKADTVLADKAVSLLGVAPESAAIQALQGALLLARNRQDVTLKLANMLYTSAVSERVRVTLPLPPANAPAVAWSSDGSEIAVAGSGQVGIWNATSGKPVGRMPVNGALAIASGPDGKWALAAGRTVVIADPRSPGTPRRLSGSRDITRLAFSPNGRYVAGLSENELILWDLQSNAPPRELGDAKDQLSAVAFSPTGAFVSAGGVDKSLIVWESASGEVVRTFSGHTDAVNDIVFSPDGSSIASASDDGTARIWNMLSTQIVQYHHSDHVSGVAFTAGGTRLITRAANDLVTVWAAGTEREIDHFTLPARGAFAFSPDGTGLVGRTADGHMQVWDVTPGRGVYLGTHSASVSSLSAAGNNTFLTGSTESAGTTLLWDLSMPGQELRYVIAAKTGESGISATAFNRKGSMAAVGRTSGTIALYRLPQPQQPVMLSSVSGRVQALAFSPDGSRLAAAIGNAFAQLRVWNTETAAPVLTVGLAGGVSSLTFSNDGNYLLAAGSEGLIRWYLMREDLHAEGTLRADPTAAYDIAFSPDGRLLATSGADKTAKIWAWNQQSGQMQLRDTLTAHTASVRSVAFSPDGTLLATGGGDASVAIWKVDAAGAASRLVTFPTGGNSVSGVGFAADSRQVIVTTDDGGVRLFPVPARAPIPAILPYLTRTPQPGECVEEEVCPQLTAALGNVVEGNALARSGDSNDALIRFAAARREEPFLSLSEQDELHAVQNRTASDSLRHSAWGMFTQAEALARAGLADRAKQLVAEIRGGYANGFDAAKLGMDATQILVKTYTYLANAAAARQDIAAEPLVRHLYEQAGATDPSAKIDAPGETRKAILAALTNKINGEVGFSEEKVKAALEDLAKARKYAGTPLSFDSDSLFNNQLCWFGSIKELDLAKNQAVRDACQLAVTLTQERVTGFRDSRGVNRARNGDFAGAIADFQAYVDGQENATPNRADRMRWIETLKQGRDPFTADELAHLH